MKNSKIHWLVCLWLMVFLLAGPSLDARMIVPDSGADDARIRTIDHTTAPQAYDISFSYDAEGRRVKKHVVEYADGSPVAEKTITYVWDGWELLYERHQLPSGLTTLERKYLWGPDIADGRAGGAGGLLLMREKRGDTTTEIIPLYDGTGHVVALTDIEKNLLAEYAYGPFGEKILATGSRANSNPWRYATKYLDQETGLYYFGHRYYDPVTGQWLSREPLGESESINLYVYAGNDPINHVDVQGLYKVGFLEFTDGGGISGFLSESFGYMSDAATGFAIDGGYDVAMSFRRIAEAPGIAAALYVEDPRGFSTGVAEHMVKTLAFDSVDLLKDTWRNPSYLYRDVGTFANLYTNNDQFRSEVTDIFTTGGILLANPISGTPAFNSVAPSALARPLALPSVLTRPVQLTGRFEFLTRDITLGFGATGVAARMTAYRAIDPRYTQSTLENGFYRSGAAGRLGNDGIYANSSVKGAIAEFQYHNPGVSPSVFEVKYPAGSTLNVSPPAGNFYIESPLPFTHGANVLAAPSLRQSGTTNFLIRNGAIPGSIIQ